MELEWDDSAFLKEVNSILLEKLDVVGRHLMEVAAHNISTPPPASKPFGFPHMDSEELYKSVDYEMDPKEMAVKVGTNLEYGRFLEEKSPQAGGRPWLSRTLDEEKPTVRAILEA